MSEEIVFLRDKEWGLIDMELCLVKEFTPMATVDANGGVRALGLSMPYASIEFECAPLPQDATGFITHKTDFLHLWAAFNERGVGEDEEVIVIWSKKNLRRSARLMSKVMPKLIVWICPKDAYRLMSDNDFRPELTASERFDVSEYVVEWKPDVMML